MPLPTIPSGNVASALPTGFDIDNSCRFNDGDSAYISRTLGTPSNADRFTLSMWIKRGTNLAAEQPLFVAGSSSSQGDLILFRDDAKLEWQMYHGSTTMQYKTNREFRDVAAWYHLVFTYDSGNGTAGDRQRIYVNGVEETSFAISTDVAQNTDSKFNSALAHGIGYDTGLGLIGSKYFDGYMAEVALCDGQAYAASDFGEFDEDSPTIWKPKDISGLTFGDNGFYLDFEASANLGNDANGGTDWTENNIAAADQATDTPTNNFATLNPLFKTQNSGTLSEGNCIYTSSTSAWGGTGSTFGLSKGKWFWEAKIKFDNLGGHFVGVIDESLDVDNSSSGPHQQTGSTLFYPASGGQMYKDGSGSGSYGTFSDGEVMGFALNLDDDEISIYQNGSAIVTDYALSTTKNTLFVWVMAYNSGADFVKVNFGGCPPFSISSANADGNGYGSFEYSVPSGYYAICSKNLAEFG